MMKTMFILESTQSTEDSAPLTSTPQNQGTGSSSSTGGNVLMAFNHSCTRNKLEKGRTKPF